MSNKPEQWNLHQAAALYQVAGWGGGFFKVNELGHVEAVIEGRGRIDLKQLCDDLAARGLHPPLLLRFSDILRQRMLQLHRRFASACKEADYPGRYYGVYPIKVNQQRQVVEEIIEFGAALNWGLEVGSKPELHAVMALLGDLQGLVICNGYKDVEFIELALMGLKMGKRIFIVVEKPNELALILDSARRLGVAPLIGLRCRLSSTGSGFWEDSGGDKSKFGLSASDLLDAITTLKAAGMLDCLRLLHFHIGSQIPRIRSIKNAMQEAARYYVEARKLGAPIEFMDVGGGLGVNYDGTISGNRASVDYSLQEYVNDVIWALKLVCDEESLPYPHIVSESGRALVAHHAVLITDVLGTIQRIDETAPREPGPETPLQLRELWETLRELDLITPREALHDVIALREDMGRLFSLGHASLTDRAHAEALYWWLVAHLAPKLKQEEVEQLIPGLETQLADRYFCNLSIFQSLPDAWAIRQLFPVMPIHRLQEPPSRQGILVDITCDSDGTIQRFPLRSGVAPALPLHSFKDGEHYLLGLFLTGAYQEILGDLHNLFGDTHAIHVRMEGEGYELEQVIEGESVAEVLEYVQFHETVLVHRMRRQLLDARNQGLISAREANAFLRFYQQGLKGYTYLEEEETLLLEEASPAQDNRPS